ncbi:MAG: hypothetical protein DMG42_36210 [Acidobacteria bacterium]|nr:MAG: hypothetical protein DMG42_36210 [Acidobacteriota bacterium]
MISISAKTKPKFKKANCVSRDSDTPTARQLRTRFTTHVISEDGKRIAAQLGNAVWGILDATWTEKGNGLRVESPKPFVIN